MHILAKNETKHGISTSLLEIVHQLIAVIQVMTANCINHFTAQLIHDTLRVDNFLSAGMRSNHRPDENQLEAAASRTLTPEGNDSSMMRNPITLPVYCVTETSGVNGDELFKSFRMVSHCISAAKVNSACPNALSLIGD